MPTANGRDLLTFVVPIQRAAGRIGFLGSEPNGPLVDPLPDRTKEDPFDVAMAPPGAAVFRVYAAPTAAENVGMRRRLHELAGGLRNYLDLCEAVDVQWRELRGRAEAACGAFVATEGPPNEDPAARELREQQERAQHNHNLLVWAEQNLTGLFLTAQELGATHNQVEFVARLETLLLSAPPAYLPVSKLGFADQERWAALMTALDAATAQYLRGKALPSAG